MPNNGITSVHRDDSVSIGETPVGKGVFSERSYPANAVIGEITGDVVKNCPSGSRYSFEIDDRTNIINFRVRSVAAVASEEHVRQHRWASDCRAKHAPQR